MTFTPTREPSAPPTPEPVEVLIKEARARQRRHYGLTAIAVLVVVASVGAGIYSGTTGGNQSGHGVRPASGPIGGVPLPLTLAHPPSIGVLGVVPGPLRNTGTIYTWSGARYSTVRATAGTTLQEYNIALSPNGRSLLAYANRGESLSVLPSSRVGARSTYRLARAVWGDDGQHLCSLNALTTRPLAEQHAELVITTLGQSSRNVARLVGGWDHGGEEILACNVSANFAILAGVFMGEIRSVTYINLQTGTKWPAPWYDYKMGTVQLSGNGQYAATGGGSTGGGEVIDTATGEVVGHFPGQSLGISWLGHLVLVLGDNLQVPEVYDWQANKVIWMASGFAGPCPCYSATLGSTVRPGTDEMAINVSHGETEAQFQSHDEYLRATLWIITKSRSWIVTRDVAPA